MVLERSVALSGFLGGVRRNNTHLGPKVGLVARGDSFQFASAGHQIFSLSRRHPLYAFVWLLEKILAGINSLVVAYNLWNNKIQMCF
jgi:hypothetical protein